ncbi:MAG: hypothetical protein IIU97_01055, partial [Bacteroidaceae bacterium]|nr:hypothetical protein [Bacteroidaceae bacterium]
MGKTVHERVHADNKQMGEAAGSAITGKMGTILKGLPSLLRGNLFAVLFFVAVWALLAFGEQALLFRVNELSVFLYDNLFFEEMMAMPAGILYYVA